MNDNQIIYEVFDAEGLGLGMYAESYERRLLPRSLRNFTGTALRELYPDGSRTFITEANSVLEAKKNVRAYQQLEGR